MHRSDEGKSMKSTTPAFLPIRMKRLPEFLAIAGIVLTVFLAVPAHAAEVQVRNVGRTLIEVTGGSGGAAWHIQYGDALPSIRGPFKVLTAEGPGSTAYFSHASWLRRVDVEKGIVTGRWHFPCAYIANLQVKADGMEVEVETPSPSNELFRRIIKFDPVAPSIPFWLPGPQYFDVGMQEAGAPMVNSAGSSSFVEFARQRLPEVENAARRDPLSPWLLAELGRLYRAVGRSEADAMFAAAVKVEPADFTELLPLSVFLDNLNEPAAAGTAFERGYEDYWKRGNDP